MLMDINALDVLDPEGMRSTLADMPAQCRAALELGRTLALPPGTVRHIVITGLGGSAIGGDLLRAWARPISSVPITVNREYDLPPWVGPDTAVIASSYSGSTEETLAAYDMARSRGAWLMVLSTGGELTERARRDGVAVGVLPDGLQPRAALPYGFFPLLVWLERLGCVPSQALAITHTLAAIDAETNACGMQIAEERNTARQLARKLLGTVPVIWACGQLGSVVALRWKSQLNENAKVPAFFHAFPELNHNETEGLAGLQVGGAKWAFVFLRMALDDLRLQRRADLSLGLLPAGVPGHVVRSQGADHLAQAWSLIVQGDWMTYYLALLRGVRPVPVPIIETFKKMLAE